LGGWKMPMNDAARRAPSRVLRGTEDALRKVLRHILRHVLHVHRGEAARMCWAAGRCR